MGKKNLVVLLAMLVLSALTIISLFALCSMDMQQRFILKCTTELGSNNIELCSSIAK
jgi:hypothetical protein